MAIVHVEPYVNQTGAPLPSYATIEVNTSNLETEEDEVAVLDITELSLYREGSHHKFVVRLECDSTDLDYVVIGGNRYTKELWRRRPHTHTHSLRSMYMHMQIQRDDQSFGEHCD